MPCVVKRRSRRGGGSGGVVPSRSLSAAVTRASDSCWGLAEADSVWSCWTWRRSSMFGLLGEPQPVAQSNAPPVRAARASIAFGADFMAVLVSPPLRSTHGRSGVERDDLLDLFVRAVFGA